MTHLIPHDHVSETFVCRDCGHETDLASDVLPDAYTKADADEGRCPKCGGTDTAWMHARYVVRCIWDTTVSVPGGHIESRHGTLAEAEAAKARLDAIEADRRANPRITKTEARRAAVEQYGSPGDNLHMQGVIREAVRRLTSDARRRTEYVVERCEAP